MKEEILKSEVPTLRQPPVCSPISCQNPSLSLLSPSPTYLLSVPAPPTFHGAPAPQLPSPPQVLTFLSVMTRFLVPAMQPFSMTKSLLTSP